MSDDQNAITEILGKYENFIEDHFKSLPTYSTAMDEFKGFKNEILGQLNQGDAHFEQYAKNQKKKMKEELMAFSEKRNCSRASRGIQQDYTIFELLKIYSGDEFRISNYLSSYRIHTSLDLIKEWEEERESIILQDSKLISEIKDIETIQGIYDFDHSLLQFLAKKERKLYYMLLAERKGYPFVERLVFGLFMGVVERKLVTYEEIVQFFTEMYNICHHFGLKTEHFLLFNNLCRYFQFILHYVCIKKIGNQGLYQPCVINLISKTFHSKNVMKGLKHLFIELAKISLNIISPQHIRTILSLYSDEQFNVFLHRMNGFLSDLSSDSQSTNSPEIQHNDLLGKFISLVCFCFRMDIYCVLFMGNSETETINYVQNSMDQFPMLVLSKDQDMSLLLYGGEDEELVKRLRRVQSTFSLDDFLSLSDGGSEEDNHPPLGIYTESKALEKGPIKELPLSNNKKVFVNPNLEPREADYYNGGIVQQQGTVKDNYYSHETSSLINKP